MDTSDPFEAYKEALHTQYSQLTSYSNLILGAGYAGIFATWSLTKDSLGKASASWVGLLIIVSLFFFVLFEIIRMVCTTVELEKQSKALSNREQYLELMAAFAATQTGMAHRLRFVWYVFFSISFLTAFCAAAVLACAFVGQLAGP